jgi:phosphinothricin acetyltransferase
MTPADWPSVRDIYEAGIATCHATFETTAPDWEHWDTAHLAEQRIVATIDGEVIGWTAMSPVSDRCPCGVAEHSVYVTRPSRPLSARRSSRRSSQHRGRHLDDRMASSESTASVELHQRCGFESSVAEQIDS